MCCAEIKNGQLLETMANAPELDVGISKDAAGKRTLSITCIGDTNSSFIEIPVHSFADMGNRDESPRTNNDSVRKGHLFHLNGAELKVLGWDKESEDPYPEISYQNEYVKITHHFDTRSEGKDLSYDGLVAHFQAFTDDRHAAPIGDRRRRTRRAQRSARRSHRRGTAGRRK
jgi:hypothetical protein